MKVPALKPYLYKKQFYKPMKKTKIIEVYLQFIIVSIILIFGTCLFQLIFILGINTFSFKLLLIPIILAFFIGIFIATILVYRKLTPEHPLKTYITYTLLSFCIIETFFSLQVIFVLKDFKPQYAIIPTTLSIIIGLLLSTVIVFKQRLQKSHKDLANAHHEIQHLNQQLKTDNSRMSTELAIAQKLQQMLLPKPQDLQQNKNLDIASLMQVADKISGDYYDIIQHGKHTRIVIGDVTGHGLESGLFMLMVQSALHALINHDVSDPIQLFKSLNRSIYQNIKRTQMDKNLTLTMLDYADGQITITGQHEKVIIVRHNGQIEVIDTLELGFMIGIEPDISHLLASIDIQLNIGDGIVLYTDGLIEAQNTEKEIFGLERLCGVLSQYWENNTAAKMIEHTMQALQIYMQTQDLQDDLTLLICKQQSIKTSK